MIIDHDDPSHTVRTGVSSSAAHRPSTMAAPDGGFGSPPRGRAVAYRTIGCAA
jgi:hypothetical protein